MSKSRGLPARPNLEYLKKLAKKRLRAMRKSDSAAQLADAQLAVSRENGFSSWRAMRAQIEAQIDPARIVEFFALVDDGNTKAVVSALKANPSLAASRDAGGRSPLHAAAGTNAADIVQLLLRAGVNANAKFGESAHTALSWSLTMMAYDAARALIAGGVKPDLFCAAGLGALDAVRGFFDARGNLKKNASQTGSSRFTPDGKPLPRPPVNDREVISDALYIACRNAHADVVRFLLQHDPDLSFRAFLGGPLLHWAHFGGLREVIQMLLDAGADAGERDPVYRCTPRAFGICVPSNWGIAHLVLSRLQEDRTLATIDEGRGTPLHEAARGGHLNIAKLLLATGANPQARDSDGKKPVDLAKAEHHEEVVKLLSHAKQFKSAVAKKVRWQPIMDAAFNGDVERVGKLIDAGFDPNIVSTTMHHHRPLHRAIEFKKTIPRNKSHEEVVKLLLSRGANPKLRATLEQLTALQLSAIGDTRFVPLLSDRFKPLDIFHAAVMGDSKRVTELLKQNGSLASKRDENSWTPLHYCAASRVASDQLPRIAKLLIDAGADPMATWMFQNEHPLRPLYYACGRSNNAAVAKVLLEAGADPCDGESVYHAADEQHQECLDLIERFVEPKKLAKECHKAIAVMKKWGRKRGLKWLNAHAA